MSPYINSSITPVRLNPQIRVFLFLCIVISQRWKEDDKKHGGEAIWGGYKERKLMTSGEEEEEEGG